MSTRGPALDARCRLRGDLGAAPRGSASALLTATAAAAALSLSLSLPPPSACARYLRKQSLRDFLRVIASDKLSYKLSFYKIEAGDKEDDE